jgi:biphenyl 2,3-dioxygenase beta subunit
VPTAPAEPVALDLYFELQQVLFREARLLDERRYMDWIALLADDCTVRVPTRDNIAMDRDSGRAAVDAELSELCYFEDDKLTLLGRVMRLGTGTAWGENPPSRTRRFVGNVEVLHAEAPGELRVLSNLLIRRTRRASERNWFAGARRDVWRRTEKGWLLVSRSVVLDDSVIDSPNISVFF